MKPASTPPSGVTVLMDLPHTPGRAALRAALMGMRIPPVTLPSDAGQRRRLLATLSDDTPAVAFIDISRSPQAPATGLVELFGQVPAGEGRQRIMLTRLAEGHVSEADRQWVRSLGFADLLADLDPANCEGALRQTVDWAAGALRLPTLPPSELARFVRAGSQAPLAGDARELIRRRTGLGAEAFASQLVPLLDIEDRRWRLSTYPRCFVGRDAVARVARHWRCTAPQAVELGQALGRLGLLVHVMQEHPFLDDHLFYRLAWSDAPGGIDLGALWETLSLPGGVDAKTRNYLGKAYPDCWVGSDAVDLLCARHRLDRLEAWLALHRLMRFGLFEHVTRARPFIDGEFFYRFAPTGTDAAD